ncbi:uncharacterized protein [Argopecten irradians]|uniref:uncharacterized protein n=1 Tax=Argopecten irradians TaxID=31199 RepID=UPI00371FD27B
MDHDEYDSDDTPHVSGISEKVTSNPGSPTFAPKFGFAVKLKKTVRFKDQVKTFELDRRQLGRCLTKLESLQSFGELPFLSSEFAGEGSVVADEDTELMLVPSSKVYERVQCYEKRELDQKKLFVRTHSFFSKWPEPQQEQIISELTRSYCPLGCTVVRQGAPVDGLHFLIRGRARLSTTPSKHRKQYPDLFVTLDGLRKTPDFSSELVVKLPPLNTRGTMVHHTQVKRTGGYAAAERLVFDQNIELCFVEEGEICCDTEILLGLETNIFTVTASTSCELYTLNLKNYEKYIIKKNPQTVNLIRMIVETKLLGRKSTIPGNKIELLPLLLDRLRYVRQVHIDLAEESKEDGRGVDSSVHDGSQERNANPKSKKHLNTLENKKSEGIIVEWYKKNKAPLLKPVTEGAIYYKDLMQKRAKIREDMRSIPTDTAVCQAIRKRVKDAILVSIKEGLKTDKMVRKLQLQLSKGTIMSRWK